MNASTYMSYVQQFNNKLIKNQLKINKNLILPENNNNQNNLIN